MKEAIEIIDWKKQFSSADNCLLHSIESGIPTAIWRLPNQNQVVGIIDFHHQQDHFINDLDNTDPGFIINAFDQHHPSKATSIRADVMVEWSQSQPQDFTVKVAPRVSASDIESLLNDNPNTRRQFVNGSDTQSHDYEKTVRQALEEIAAGTFTKVVLSRFEDTTLREDFDIMRFFDKACASYPNAFCYLLYTPAHGLWMGASPETLLSMEDGLFQTMSLAGTQRLDNRSLQDIAWTQKDIEEQAMVSRYIIDCFKKIRLREFEENGPRTALAGNLVHLKTTYKVDTRKVEAEQLATTMMNLLHPTSAVCGMPLQPALDFIKQYEQYDRKLYAGFLGPVNIKGLTHLFVNLRCMEIIDSKHARLYAGAGITADSDPHKELMETQMKMNTLKKLMES